MRKITQADGPRIQERGRSAIKRPNPVFLLQLDEDAEVETVDGTLTGKAGDFLAFDPISTHVWPVKASYVEQHYTFTPEGQR
ncbi:MAG TPA: hypothetical protein VJ247_04615 [Gaiella sp.]|jgi:hypothetical protein|nr:hypothetical protein [Gaiella sp.]